MNNRPVCICGKRIYRTRKSAWNDAVFYFQKTGVYSSVYKCPTKERYHLTRQRNTPPKYFWKKMSKWFGVSLYD